MCAFGHSSHAASTDNPESLVNQFYELAQKGSKPDNALVSSLNSSLEKKGSSFGPQEIANLLWSVAKTGTKLDPKILASLVGLVSAKAGSFKPAQISAVLWALGTLGQKVDAGKLSDGSVSAPVVARCILLSCVQQVVCAVAYHSAIQQSVQGAKASNSFLIDILHSISTCRCTDACWLCASCCIQH